VPGEVTLVTPTFLPDRARCELLVESRRRCGPWLDHVLVVDRRERAAFAALEGAGTRIIVAEDVAPPWLHRLPGRRGVRVSWRTRPVRGWMWQQMLKLAVAARCESEHVVFADSDTAFIREFTRDELLGGAKSELLDVDHVNAEVLHWTRIAARLLGLPDESVRPRGHVGNLICWRSPIVEQMLGHLDDMHGDWRRAVLGLPTVSEYILYGVYVRCALGYDASDHVPSSRHLVEASWGDDLTTPASMASFFHRIVPETLAVMIHSKCGIPVEAYAQHVSRGWPPRERSLKSRF